MSNPKWPITLGTIREQRPRPCANGWWKLLHSLGYADGDYDPERTVTLGDIAVSNGAEHALWCTRCLPGEARRDVVRAILPAVERVSQHTDDRRVHDCIATLRRWVDGQADVGEVRAARKAAADAEAVAAWAAAAVMAAARKAAADAEAVAAWAAAAVMALALAATAEAESEAAAEVAWSAWAARAAAAHDTEHRSQVEDIVAVFGRSDAGRKVI